MFPSKPVLLYSHQHLPPTPQAIGKPCAVIRDLLGCRLDFRTWLLVLISEHAQSSWQTMDGSLQSDGQGTSNQETGLLSHSHKRARAHTLGLHIHPPVRPSISCSSFLLRVPPTRSVSSPSISPYGFGGCLLPLHLVLSSGLQSCFPSTIP